MARNLSQKKYSKKPIQVRRQRETQKLPCSYVCPLVENFEVKELKCKFLYKTQMFTKKSHYYKFMTKSYKAVS